jgi:type I restriction enzyme S subunit
MSEPDAWPANDKLHSTNGQIRAAEVPTQKSAVVGARNDVPSGWVWTTLGKITRVNYRDSTLRELPDDLPVTFVPMAAVDADGGSITAAEQRTLRAVRKGYTSFSDGDVIFAKMTPCMENGKAAIARTLTNGRGFGSTEFHVLKPAADVLPEWIFYFVRQENFRQDAKANFTGTAGQLRVPASFLEDYPIPLPALAEQRRIVEAIEQQLTRLDAGVTSLRRVQIELHRYKAAVLKAACEGRLVPQDPSDEPAEVLLRRILDERRAKWETEQIAKMQAQGRMILDDGWRAKYQEPQGPDMAGLPKLPEGWVWARVKQVGKVQLGRQRAPQHDSGDYMRPYLRVANVYEDRIDTSDVLEMNFTPAEYETYRLEYGDILLNEGQSKELVGRPAMYRNLTVTHIFWNLSRMA